MKDLLAQSQFEKIDQLLAAVRRSYALQAPPETPEEKSSYVGLTQKEIQRYSILDAARCLHTASEGAQAGRGFHGLEAECHRELEKIHGLSFSERSFYVPREVLEHAPASRAMATIPGAKGGYLAPASIQSFLDQLQNASVCFQLGAQRLQHHTAENVIVTKQLTGPTFTWIAQGVAASASDPSFGQLSASPKTLVSLTEISAQARLQSGPVAEAFVRRNLALGLAAGVDQAMLVGSGGVQPLGLTNTPGINTVAGASLDRAKAIDMQKQACDANAVVNPLAQGYVCPPTTAALLANRQEYTGVASTLWSGSIAKGQIVGVPAMSSKAMTAGSLLFGDLSQLILLEFSAMQIAVNVADFNKGTLAIRALWMVDTICAEPKSFTLATSVT